MKLRENNRQALVSAIRILEKGGIIAYPTETFYALGVKFDLPGSLQNLYEIKKRPREKALPLIIGDRRMIGLVAAPVSKKTLSLMDRFWPGPLTLLLTAKENLSEYLTAGTHTVAVRIPGRSFALDLAQAVDFPITATSANISGMPPAQDAATVVRYFGDTIDLVVDGGKTPGGNPSTIADVTGKDFQILREGAIEKEVLYGFVGESGN
ncbi:MAG: L-threonylcarbamoyladenylate synthase [Thermodesulfovibrionales bacterium]|nr:L-threonylcarbamoyladenylate synthase [Thermodesulfovibrionales bacterium]